MLIFDNASAWELPDREFIRTEYAADLVIFYADAIKPEMPPIVAGFWVGAQLLV